MHTRDGPVHTRDGPVHTRMYESVRRGWAVVVAMQVAVQSVIHFAHGLQGFLQRSYNK